MNLIFISMQLSEMHRTLIGLRLLADLLVLLSTHRVTKHLTRLNKLRQPLSCNLIIKIKFLRKYSYFSSASFWFWGVKIWCLKLSIQAQILKAAIQNKLKKVISKIWNSLENIREILLKLHYEFKLFQVCSLQSL